MALKLLYAKHGATGVLRRYQHPKFGMIESVTMWRDPGAHIIHIETETDRARWHDMVENVRRKCDADPQFSGPHHSARSSVGPKENGEGWIDIDLHRRVTHDFT